MPNKGGPLPRICYQFSMTVKDVPEFITTGSWNPLYWLKIQHDVSIVF